MFEDKLLITDHAVETIKDHAGIFPVILKFEKIYRIIIHSTAFDFSWWKKFDGKATTAVFGNFC
jgi:hypothetical protein